MGWPGGHDTPHNNADRGVLVLDSTGRYSLILTSEDQTQELMATTFWRKRESNPASTIAISANGPSYRLAHCAMGGARSPDWTNLTEGYRMLGAIRKLMGEGPSLGSLPAQVLKDEYDPARGTAANQSGLSEAEFLAG